MIIPKAKQLSAQQKKEVESIVHSFDCHLQEIQGAHRSIYAILGDETHSLMFKRIEGLPYIERIEHIDSPYKLMHRDSQLAQHRMQIGESTLGQELCFIAGPCTIDPQEPQRFIESAHAIKEAGAHAIRGGVWKPRTVPYSYQGSHQALDIILEARQQTGLPINIEVMDEQQLALALEAQVDILQIGTRNGLNYSLLKAIGQATAHSSTIVLLKRSRHMAPISEFIAAAEYIAAAGNPNIALCPRGTMPALDGYRNHPDESITPLLKEHTWAPVIWDASHAVGHARYVPASVLAGVAYGADGLNLECNIEPALGIGDDPKQAITPSVLQQLILDSQQLYQTIAQHPQHYRN